MVFNHFALFIPSSVVQGRMSDRPNVLSRQMLFPFQTDLEVKLRVSSLMKEAILLAPVETNDVNKHSRNYVLPVMVTTNVNALPFLTQT